jgi:anti-sigma factor RsiW
VTGQGHPIAKIHLWHDGRLSAEERSQIQAHLEGCPECRSEFDALGALDAAIRPPEGPESPLGLEVRLRRTLDAEDTRRDRVKRRRRWSLPAAATVAVVILALVIIRVGLQPDWPRLAATAHAELERGQLQLDVREKAPQLLERELRARGATIRVLDLAMMGFELLGGSVREVEGHRVALVAYRNAAGQILLCEMFLGRDVRLPKPLEERRQGAIVFSVYAETGRTAVFWREGSVLCGLVSGGSRDAVVALAMAKARVN